MNPHMRVRPQPLRDRAFEHDDLVGVERRVAVVRERGRRRQQRRGDDKRSSHVSPPTNERVVRGEYTASGDASHERANASALARRQSLIFVIFEP